MRNSDGGFSDIFSAMATQQRCVCARCWGKLITLASEEHGLVVRCANGIQGKCDGKGYVTKRYTERRLSESKAELWEVYDNYPELAPKIVLNEAAILAELGF